MSLLSPARHASLIAPTGGTASVATIHRDLRSLWRGLALGAAAVILTLLAISQSAAVGAASPYPPNTVVSTYTDPRYCDGLVSVATDAGSNLIDICTTTGQRIYPVYADVAPGYVAPNYLGANYLYNNGAYPYVNGAFTNGTNPYVNNAFVNGAYSYPFNNGVFNNGAFPAGGTVVGNTVFYTDNRFCTDGKIAFVPGTGYFCQNGGPLVTNNSPTPTTTVNCSNFYGYGCGAYYRPLEVSNTDPAPATTPAVAPQTVAAPVAPTTTTVTTQAAPVAPVANTATALNSASTSAPAASTAPTSATDIHVFSVSPAAPVAAPAGSEANSRDSR